MVMTLPPRYRDPIVLYYFQDMNVVETARILGIPEGTLKARLHRGKDFLRRRLKAAGVAEARPPPTHRRRSHTDMDDLDRLLASDDAMVPSARFTADVMERIASEPTEPVVFPWGRFAAGVLACMAWAACGVWILESAGACFSPIRSRRLLRSN